MGLVANGVVNGDNIPLGIVVKYDPCGNLPAYRFTAWTAFSWRTFPAATINVVVEI